MPDNAATTTYAPSNHADWLRDVSSVAAALDELAKITGGSGEFDGYLTSDTDVTSTATVPISVVRTNVGDEFTLNSNEVTVASDGLYEIEARVTLAADGSSAYVGTAWIEVDSSELAGSRMYTGAT